MNEDVNTMTVKQNKHNYNFKYPTTNGEDYWTIQHYKMEDIKDVSSSEK